MDTLYIRSRNAEAIKLFSNTYLAMHVAFFNELDSFALVADINCLELSQGVSLYQHIENRCNSPRLATAVSTFPKIQNNYLHVMKLLRRTLFKRLSMPNTTRKDFLADQIVKKDPKLVGVYCLVMKADNHYFRQSSVQGIKKKIKAKCIKVVVFEPKLKDSHFFNSSVEKDLTKFKADADIIIANRISSDRDNVAEEVFTPDLFGDH